MLKINSLLFCISYVGISTAALRRYTVSNLKKYLCGFFLAMYAVAPALAFSPLQAPILNSAAVTPNVMFLLDNSLSMNSLIQPSGVELLTASAKYRSGSSWIVTANNDYNTLSSIGQSGCASNFKAIRNNAATSGSERCYRLPDPVGSGNTVYPAKLLTYIYNNFASGSDLRTVLTNDFRLNVAKNVTKQLVQNNRSLRYGFFVFNNQAGGSLKDTVANTSAVVSSNPSVAVTQVRADANYNDLISKISALAPAQYTPLAESYYEVSRYFRGLTSYQGSPATTYTSPIQYRCQKNFGIVVTDGLPTFDRTFPNTLAGDPLYVSGKMPNWDGNKLNDGADLNGDDEGDTLYLDDMAKFVYDIDLKDTTTADMAGKSYNDPAFLKQNMNTYTVGFSINNQMLIDAANYGQGKAYTANNASELSSSLTQALNEISSIAGSGGAGASSSATLTTETRYYKTLYDPKGWRGTIEAYKLSPSTGRIVGNKLWSTDTTITPTANAATYQTYNTGTNSVVALNYADVSTAQKAVLDAGLTSPATGTTLVNWIKGTNSAGMRTRTVLLGDVVNSSLERLSPTDQLASSITGDSSYSTYLSNKASMTNSLLVNGNDGLFHVLDAKTGAHRYGYLSSVLFPKLRVVSHVNYATNDTHTFMADGPITVADAQLSSNWNTIAVAGLGAGGRSVFAVRLFDGSSNAINALWEISAPTTNTPANSWNNLGYSYSKAVVARTQAGQWVAVFGNGYGSNTGKASLFVVDVATGALVKEIVVDQNTTGTSAEIAAGTGLSSPQVVVNAQYQIEKVYAGDLKGNLWEINLAGSTADWGVANSGAALFAAGAGHPITAQPLIVEHPTGGHMILFGSGKLNEAIDKSDLTLQKFYGIWDQAANNSPITESSLQPQSITSEMLVNGEQFFTTSISGVPSASQRGWYLPLIYNGVNTGERVIYPAQTTEGRVVFVTAKVDALDPCQTQGSGRLVELDLLTGSMLEEPVLDTDGNGVLSEADAVTSGVILGGGLPGMPVILDKGDEKPTQTKVLLLSTGENKFIDERAGASNTSRRIMWRQLQ